MVEGMERVLGGSQATTCRNIFCMKNMRKKEREEEEEEGKEEVAEVEVVAVAVGEKKGQVVEHLLPLLHLLHLLHLLPLPLQRPLLLLLLGLTLRLLAQSTPPRRPVSLLLTMAWTCPRSRAQATLVALLQMMSSRQQVSGSHPPPLPL
jgi:hypothetical protein